MRQSDRVDFDVIVLGSGIAGTLLSTILARHGCSVLVLDGAVHPRFAIGESTIPQTSQLLTLLSREHDVPEIGYLGLASPGALREHVTRSCGIKRMVAFVYQRPGELPRLDETHVFGNVWREENHFFRQDIDAFLLVTALRYGVTAVQGVRIERVDVGDSGVAVSAGGRRYTGRFVVDGTGHRSVLAEQFGLREEPCSLEAHTRSLFTHMVGVAPFEDVVSHPNGHRWSRATLHHCFQRGWIWVIPFNNWDGAPNPLVSVGLQLDPRFHPEDSALSPEEEFARHIERFPAVARQFSAAVAVRPWVRTQRLQYASRRTIGPRFALLSHAAGFVDPLYSRGLISTVDGIRALVPTLLEALRDGDFCEDRFADFDRGQRRNIQFADRLVAGSYAAWNDFALWNAWVRLWAIGVHSTESRIGSVLLTGAYSRVVPTADCVASPFEEPSYRPLFDRMWATMARYEAGELPAEAARAELWDAITRAQFTIPLPDGRQHHEWAFRQPRCRDLFLGPPENHARWAAQRLDAFLEHAPEAGPPEAPRPARRAPARGKAAPRRRAPSKKKR